MKKRIKNVLRYRKPSFLISAIAMVFVMAVTVAFAAERNGNIPDFTTDEHLDDSNEDSTSEKEYDISRFFVNKVDFPEVSAYSVCYKEEDGSITKIVDMGIAEQPLIIVGERIYYATGLDIISVNFEGKDQKAFHENTENKFIDFSFERINKAENGWLSCTGRKRVQIYNDPVALDGDHFLPINMKINVDLSGLEENE